MKKNLFLKGKMPAEKWISTFCLCLFLVATPMYALAVPKGDAVRATQQARTVKGTVIDETGEPVIGANVKVVGTTIGSITDLDGNFTLSVTTGEKLEISFIGYTTQVVDIPANGSVKVTLAEDSKLLDEVIVVGYGTQRVKDLTGAASHVKMDEIADLPGASIIDAIAGQVVGLNVTQSDGRPGSVCSMKVRQPVTFATGSNNFNNPLIVIDDVVQIDDKGEPSIHYDMYDPAKGNDWLKQTEGWMVANANPAGGSNMAEQNGIYVYCTPE